MLAQEALLKFVERLKRGSVDESNREAGKKVRRINKLATLYRCVFRTAGNRKLSKNSRCIVVRVRGSLMGIRIARQMKWLIGRKQSDKGRDVLEGKV